MAKYEIFENDGRAVIVDARGRSIANVNTMEDDFEGNGKHYSRAVFKPDVAHRIVKALALADAVEALTATNVGASA